MSGAAAASSADGRRPPSGLDDLLARIHEAFPAVRWDRARLIDSGWDHEVVVLDERLVFRFPNSAYYDDQLAVEIAVLEYLAGRTDARIPRYSHIAPDGSFAGYPMLPGHPHDTRSFAALSAADRGRFADQLADLVSVLHAIPPTLAARVPVADRAADAAEVEQVARDRLPAVLTAAEFAVVEAILAETARIVATPPPMPVPVHGDLYEDHLLWDARVRRLAVIDFSDMERSDPAIDFGEIGVFGDGFRLAALAAYRGSVDPGLLDRARAYERWAAVFLMTDHFLVGKTPFIVARRPFDTLAGLDRASTG